MTSQLLVRPLAPSEAWFFPVGAYVGYSTRVRGHLDTAALSQAFDDLRRAYPILSSRLIPDLTGQPAIADASELPAAFTECAGNADESMAGLPELDNRTAAVHVVRDEDDTAAVTLLTHHAVADGHHSLHALSELWTFYTAHAGGTPLRRRRQDYPHSLEHALHQRGISVDVGTPELLGADIADIEYFRGIPRYARTRLSAEDTAALTAVGRRHGTTVNGLVSAALLSATAHTMGTDTHAVYYSYAVDLRTRLTPPIGYPEGTNILAMETFIADPGSDRDPIALARSITDKLRDDIATGAIYDPRQAANPGDRTTMLAASNWGIIPHLPTPADLTIEDFHPTGTGHPSPRDRYSLGTHIIFTFDGQLTVDSVATGINITRPLSESLRALARHAG
ncbi:acyltransferase [Longimycelium tulufanense]|uniref:Phthiocerol/phthiodiolone dimycocerosyl transferase n=1 Tax=Longimycelium tulufanense TaxID=907463 RepID=A0A8J3CC24_9PSEU|nr:hypothetical protein [Longimycelium tulufanense]GGM57101.1 acyltransferase [Longimycelium tulufanense]